MNSLFTNSFIKSLNIDKTKPFGYIAPRVDSGPYSNTLKYKGFVFAPTTFNSDNRGPETPEGIVLVDLFDYIPNDYINKKKIIVPMVFKVAGDPTIYIVNSVNFLYKFINLQTISVSYDFGTDGIITISDGTSQSIYQYTKLIIHNNIVYNNTYDDNTNYIVYNNIVIIIYIPPKTTTITLADSFDLLSTTYTWYYDDDTRWCIMLNNVNDFIATNSSNISKKNGALYLNINMGPVMQPNYRKLYRLLPCIPTTFNIDVDVVDVDEGFLKLYYHITNKFKINVSSNNPVFSVNNNVLYIKNESSKSLLLVSPMTSTLVIPNNVLVLYNVCFAFATGVTQVTSKNTNLIVKNNCLYTKLGGLVFIPINNPIILQTPFINDASIENALNIEQLFPILQYLIQKTLINNTGSINIVVDIKYTQSIIDINFVFLILVITNQLKSFNFNLSVINGTFIYKLNISYLQFNISSIVGNIYDLISILSSSNSSPDSGSLLSVIGYFTQSYNKFLMAIQNINTNKISPKIWSKSSTTIIVPPTPTPPPTPLSLYMNKSNNIIISNKNVMDVFKNNTQHIMMRNLNFNIK